MITKARRILQYDKDFNLKGILWTEGTDHLVIGLKTDPKGILWAFDMHNHIVIRVSPDGKQLPNHHFANRAFLMSLLIKMEIYIWGKHLSVTLISRQLYEKITRKRSAGEANIYKFDQHCNSRRFMMLLTSRISSFYGHHPFNHASVKLL